MRTQVDLDFIFILMMSAISSTSLSSLTSVIWPTRDTTRISTWLLLKRKTCHKRSLWSPCFLKR